MPIPATQSPPVVRIMFGGDVMLGRMTGETIRQRGPDYPLGPVADLMRAANLTVINLECAITASESLWPGAPKAFYFGAPPQAIETLTGAGVDIASLANNHLLDFGIEGLADTLRHLGQHGVQFAGAGAHLDAARMPIIVERRGTRFGLAAFCDHQADFAARPDRPGIAYLDLDDEPAALAQLEATLRPLHAAAVDWPILSLHWGPNMVFRPAPTFRRLAHAAIDMGWKILFGHSAHVFQGIEIYRGRPILYAAGDLVDDYYVDPDFRNDHQLLFQMELTSDSLRRIELYPVLIKNCQARPATGENFDYIASWMTALCKELGTTVRRDSRSIWIEPIASRSS